MLCFSCVLICVGRRFFELHGPPHEAHGYYQSCLSLDGARWPRYANFLSRLSGSSPRILL